MTPNEVKEAGHKFCQYLEANDSRVVSMTIGLADGARVFFGSPEMVEESLLAVVAQRHGFVLGYKS